MLGIKLVGRENSKHLKWLQHIATHCDAWLIHISFLGANLKTTERYHLILIYPFLISVYLSSNKRISSYEVILYKFVVFL
jgi:hypothetical protein